MALAQESTQADSPPAAAEQQPPADAAVDQPSPTPAASDVDTLQTVRVTGIRRSIATSRETKQDATSIVEAVSSEDLGKLPDVSIAESLARLPGLAAQRVDGRAQVIAIRGMSPDFAATLLNGREQVSTGDNRGVEFDQYPSELLDSAVVYKTPDATLIGQGLSGTVDLRTIRPLSFSERRLVFNARGEYNSLGEQNYDGSDTGYRVSASYVDQFADDTIGFAIGIARLDSPFQEKHYKAWWWGNADPWGAYPVPGKPPGAVMQMGAEVWARSRDQTRDGVMSVLEFKPNDNIHSIVDMYYSKFEQQESTRGLMWDQSAEWPPAPCVRCISFTDATTTDLNGIPIVTGGIVNNVRPIVRNDVNDRDDTMYSFGWKNEFKVSEAWSASTDLYYSRAKRSQDFLETYAGNAGRDSIGFSLPLGSSGFPTFTPGLDYTDPESIVLSDPGGWGREGRLEKTWQDDQISGIRLAVGRTFESGPFSGFDAGFAGTRRVKDKTSSVYFAQLKDGATSAMVDPSLVHPSIDLGFSGIPGSLSYDVPGVVDRYYDLVLSLSDDDLKKDFTVTEQVETAYAKLNIDTDLGEHVRLRGNVGVQLVRTDQSSEAFDIDSGQVTGNLVRGTTYDDVLPSLNLVADFGEGWIVRLGAAKTQARPRIDDLRASATAGVDLTTRTWSGNGGNPLLEPWRATSGDVSFEKYFGEASYVALALFYKDLDSYIYNQNLSDYDFSDFTNPTTIVPVSNIGNFTTPANGSGGYMRGVELSTSLEGGLFTPALDGFGILFNASYTETSIDPDPLDEARNRATLPGLSKIVANLTAYYEKNGFSARASQRYRSEFQGEVTALFAQRQYTQVLADRQLDVQVGYEFQPTSRLAGWGVLFQVNNVTNSPYRTVQRSDFANGGDFYTTPLEYNEYGRQYLLGFTYKM
ncbi:MAG: TonB-dependent receptor [Proteobacteria bacterium]|nr:TonB-dependent receptor [Burkholderiales bacterium]